MTTISNTDSRSRDGITVGLIDAILSISTALAERLKGFDNRRDGPITEALKDLGCDDNLNFVLSQCPVMRLPDEEAKLYERVTLIRKAKRTAKQDERLRELDAFVQKMATRARNEPADFGELMAQFARDIPSGLK